MGTGGVVLKGQELIGFPVEDLRGTSFLISEGVNLRIRISLYRKGMGKYGDKLLEDRELIDFYYEHSCGSEKQNPVRHHSLQGLQETWSVMYFVGCSDSGRLS